MYTIKEKAIVLTDRVKHLLTVAKNNDDETLAKFGITSHSGEALEKAMKPVKELADEMSEEIAAQAASEREEF